jgi:hypothetical protein
MCLNILVGPRTWAGQLSATLGTPKKKKKRRVVLLLYKKDCSSSCACPRREKNYKFPKTLLSLFGTPLSMISRDVADTGYLQQTKRASACATVN